MIDQGFQRYQGRTFLPILVPSWACEAVNEYDSAIPTTHLWAAKLVDTASE
jgi:hypothetical protein